MVVERNAFSEATAEQNRNRQSEADATANSRAEVDGKAVLRPSDRVIGNLKCFENPELYAVFPYLPHGVNKPDFELGRSTFDARRIKTTGGWTQDAIQAAFPGFTDTAKRLRAEDFSAPAKGIRFPVFRGPYNDWFPEQDHGSVASRALQTMLMGTEGTKIVLFPSCGKDWDVEFKPQAPLNTTVEGVFHAGKLEHLPVTPEKRSADVIKMSPE